MKRHTWTGVVLTMAVALVLMACAQPTPQVVEKQVEVTKVVEKQVPVKETVVVEKQVVQKAPIVRVAFPSIIDIDDVAAMIAFEKMQDEGLAVAPTFYSQGELAAAAVAGGQAQFGVGASTVWLGAIQAGAPIIGIMEQTANGWSVMATEDINTCEDVNGKRTAIHSEASVSTAMLRAWIGSTCPDIKPNYLVIPGSENRAAALMAGEIDVTPAELIDSVRIMELRPGEFHRIANFATDLPDLKTGGFWVRSDFAKQNPDVIKAFIRNVLEVNRHIVDDQDWFMEQVPRFLPDVETDLLPKIAEGLLSINNYPVNGGMVETSGQYTIGFFTDSGRLDPGLTAEKAYDLSYLNAVLDEIGRR